MSITDEQAQIVINAAIAKSEELGYTITVAVVDSAGEVTAVRRMDGVGPINYDFAYACAYTAATTGRTGTELDWVKDTNWWRAASVMRGGRLMVARGALPLRDGGKVIGGIGVSGRPGRSTWRSRRPAWRPSRGLHNSIERKSLSNENLFSRFNVNFDPWVCR